MQNRVFYDFEVSAAFSTVFNCFLIYRARLLHHLYQINRKQSGKETKKSWIAIGEAVRRYAEQVKVELDIVSLMRVATVRQTEFFNGRTIVIGIQKLFLHR